MKKILTLICTLLCANVLMAQTRFIVGELQYEVTEANKVKVHDCMPSATSIVIPDTVTYQETNYCVTSIGAEAFEGCSSLTSVTIPNSVTSIENNAFQSCSSLISIDIPNGVTSIGNNAFKSCSSLTSVDIPNSVTSIGNWAFSYCISLTSVTIPNSRYGMYAFENCISLTSVTIPNSVTYIEEGTFMYCSSLTSVTIPNSVTAIGYENNYWGVFQECRSLASVTIGNSVTTIGDWAFYNCSSLTSITIPSSVTYIGAAAFKCQLDQTSVGYENIPSNLAVVTCLASTPPYARGAFHHWMTWSLPQAVYVPCGSLEAYINSDWGNDLWYGSVKKIHEITYDIDATANNEVFGSVAVESDCPSATLTATANEGFAFLSWNDGNTDNPRIVSLSSDTAFTAYFGNTLIIDTICQGSTYEENNFNETEQGLYTQTTTDANGQDSVTVLSLTVNPIYETELTATICQGQAYTENNFNVSEAGVYTQTLTSVNGCDSIVTLTLNVNPIFNTELTATICEGQVYTENGFNVSEAGVYTQTLTSVNGCDSIVTLTLNVNPIYNTELTATICEGQVYTENGFNVSEAGVYTQTLTSVNGCDSIVTLNLNVNPIFNTELSATICEG